MPESPADNRPNVLLICTDHWPGALMRPAGHPVIMTPTLQQLADCGAYYPNTYSATPVCVPARRALMTGLTAKSHGVRQNSSAPMPDAPTLAQTFHDHGYQTMAVGKLHVSPPRQRLGFDDVILNEEGRRADERRRADDYEQFLADRGYTGQEFASGLNNNDYMCRPWQLPEDCHPTNWAVREMCRTIQRRDPTRPAFWYLSMIGPHPPVWPPRDYLDLYDESDMDEPVIGDWAQNVDDMPQALRQRARRYAISNAPAHEQALGRRGFYACCTHIDHQLRLVIGMLREEGLINNTVIAFTSDHGDMLGHHNLWAKNTPHDPAARVPLIVVPAGGDDRLAPKSRDDRLVELRDVMPTLLDLAGLPIPENVEGQSLVSDAPRQTLFGECSDYDPARPGTTAGVIRMMRDDRHKLIYYPAGHRFQLFDMQEDPGETHDLADDPALAEVRRRLTEAMVEQMYGTDAEFIKNGKLVGLPEADESTPRADRGMQGQRGWRFI